MSANAHVHGAASLNLAIEGTVLYLEFSSPAANLFGFEHPPADQHEQAAVARARGVLDRPEHLFAFAAAAACRLAESRVQMPWLGERAVDDGDDHAAHGADGSREHSDVVAEYRFLCDRPAAVEGARLLLFEEFPLIERLQVQYVSATGQGAVVLTPAEPVVRF